MRVRQGLTLVARRPREVREFAVVPGNLRDHKLREHRMQQSPIALFVERNRRAVSHRRSADASSRPSVVSILSSKAPNNANSQRRSRRSSSSCSRFRWRSMRIRAASSSPPPAKDPTASAGARPERTSQRRATHSSYRSGTASRSHRRIPSAFAARRISCSDNDKSQCPTGAPASPLAIHVASGNPTD